MMHHGYVIPFFLMLLTGAGAGAGVEDVAVEADMVKSQVTADEKKQRYAKDKVVRIKAQG